MRRKGYVYILASECRGTLYISVTSNLYRRIMQHKQKCIPGFTSKYNVTKLVYYEEHLFIRDALTREPQLKYWKRLWKIRLIESVNPLWEELL